MDNPLVFILVAVVVAAVISYVINAFVPVEARIKNVIQLVLWGLVLIAVIVRFVPMLGLNF